MKKIMISLIASFSFLSLLQAQITREEADGIVLEYIYREMQFNIVNVFAKKGLQTEMTITTIVGETIELDYACWIYYIQHTNADRFLIVNERNGNLMEVNTTKSAKPDDLAEWSVVDEDCQLDPDEDCQLDLDDNINIIGKWMVIISNVFPSNRYPDKDFLKMSCKYSETDIVYEFKTNGILTVSRESDYESLPYGTEKGDYEWSITEVKDSYSETGFSMRLKIGLYYWYRISCNKLVIDYLPLDGGIEYLIKID